MPKARHAILAAATAAGLVLAGCLAPYEAHVDADALAAHEGLRWRAVEAGPRGGYAVREYEHRPAGGCGGGPPYCGYLQVFSFRELGRRSSEDLVGLARGLVEDGMEAKSIQPDDSGAQEGTRVLASGLRTHWFILEGTARGSTAAFTADARVRILGEVGYDGRSATNVVAVGIAQVDSRQCAIIPIPCTSDPDLRTWSSIVGDPAGTIRGAADPDGLVHNLVTHG